MKANELRINNFIIDYEGKIGKVKTIEDYDVLKVVNNQGVLISYCEIELYRPIPLTEEILLKCGFIYFKKVWGKKVKNIMLITEENGIGICNNERYGDYEIWLLNCDYKLTYMPCWLQNLHQLQNLYFALTNEELNIEL